MDEDLITREEAARLLNMSVTAFKAIAQRGVFKTYTPTKGTAKLAYSKEEVLVYKELRTDGKLTESQLAHIALRALVKAIRTERMLESLLDYTGLNFTHLKSDRIDIETFHVQCTEYLAVGGSITEHHEMLKKLLAVDEAYLTLVFKYLGITEPWVLFMDVAKFIAVDLPQTGPIWHLANHVIRSLRNAAFQYACMSKGAVKAKAEFRQNNFSSRLAQSLFSDR